MKHKLSMIIPVYNSDICLRRCIDSVINQTLKDIQIIIVNDGSTDNSTDMINEYAQSDTRILSLYQKSPESIYAFIDQNPESVVVKSSIQVIKPEKINLMPDFPIIITVVDNAESIKKNLYIEIG